MRCLILTGVMLAAGLCQGCLSISLSQAGVHAVEPEVEVKGCRAIPTDAGGLFGEVQLKHEEASQSFNRYFHLPPESMREHEARQIWPMLFEFTIPRDRSLLESGPVRLFPPDLGARFSSIDDIPHGLRASYQKFDMAGKPSSIKQVGGRDRQFRANVEWAKRERSWWSYPLQVLQPAAIAVDIVCLPVYVTSYVIAGRNEQAQRARR